ncbi:MAG: V-type ATP synthase subunit A [Acholeplasmatales bacterium]|jgi:V/A-type H+-transporting ATPase subunit A|nr:V-type ATP synthase subunit A [Acholeplasmatales bacterium]
MNKICLINGPIVKVKNNIEDSLFMGEMVHVGNQKLIGEVIGIENIYTTIQVYESTTMLSVNEFVIGTSKPISINLGPGLIGNIFDGIGRNLQILEDIDGTFIKPKSEIITLDNKKKWDCVINKNVGDVLNYGDIFGYTFETSSIKHYFLCPYMLSEIVEINNNDKLTVQDFLIKVKLPDGTIKEVYMVNSSPIKKPRPYKERLDSSIPLITGQRVIDTFFPIAKGGASCVPGGFGAGKTMLQHQLAKWCDADIIIYVGCGERGNEMTDVLNEFPHIVDPRTSKSIMDRTVLIANTSNMPVSAREASIYTGVTIAEYYRDMGYHVALMADSTSRWAESLREISGRLEEIPAEEGFPSYLPSKLASFYERAGYVKNFNGTEGSLSIIGALSPQGGDFSEPVTQNTKRFVRSFWALDKSLAYNRHYPAVNWNLSYSEYADDLSEYYYNNISKNFMYNRKMLVGLLDEENKILEIVKLIGSDVLPESQKLVIRIGEIIRVGFLQQNSYSQTDTFVPLIKQSKMAEIIIYLYQKLKEYIQSNKSLYNLRNSRIFDEVIKMRSNTSNDNIKDFDFYFDLIDKELA